MQKLAWVWMAGISLCVTSAINAQGPPEKVRIVCDVQDPKSKCPGTDCLCTDDTFEITFAYVFRRGPDLPSPFKACGRDPTAAALDCAQSSCP